MFNNYIPWDFHQSAVQPNTFSSLSNLECVKNDIANSEAQYTGSYTKSAGNIQFNGNNMPHRYDRTFDYAISSTGTNANQNTQKNYEYAVQSNGININQNIYNNSNDSQTLHHLYNNNHLYRKDIPNYHPSSKLAQLLNNNGNANSFQNMNSHYLNQNASDQQIKYHSQSNITLNETQFQSSVPHMQLPCKSSIDQINNTNNTGELNAVPYNLQLPSTQFHNKMNRHENGLFNNNVSSTYMENNFANCSSALQKRTEETFRQQIWVKDIESLNASTINEISHSSVTEKSNQTDHLNKISDTGVSQHNARGKSVIEKSCIETATSNMLAVNLKDKPLQNIAFTNTFSSNTVSNNAKTMNCIDVKTESLVNTDSSTFVQRNEKQNEPNLDKVPSKSNKNSNISKNKTAENLNASSSIFENKILSNLYSTPLDKEENSDILQNTNKTNLTASSLSISHKQFENTVNNITKKQFDNDLNCSSNKRQKRREQRNYLTSNKNNNNNNNMESYEKYDSLPSSVLVNSSQTQDKNFFNIKCRIISNKETEIKQALQNENSSVISDDNVQLNESKSSEAVIDKDVNKAKKRKVSKVSVQKSNVRSSKKRTSTVEAKTKSYRKTGNSNVNKKDQNLIIDSVNVNSFSRKKSSDSYSNKNNKNLPNNSKTQQKSHKENKKSTVSLKESKTCNRSNYHKKVRTKTYGKNAYENCICANQNKSNYTQKSTTEVETVSKKRGRKKAHKSMYFRNSLIDRKKLDLLIKYVEGNTNLKSPDYDIKNSEICHDEDSIIENTNDGSSESETFYIGTSLNSANISAHLEDIKRENVFEVLHEKDSLVETKNNQKSQFKSASSVSQGGSEAKGMVQVFKKFINDKNDSGTNSEVEELHDICMLANFEDKTMFSDNLDNANNEGSYTKGFDEKLRELKHLGSNKCIGCESMIPMDKFWLKVTTGELKCAECLISSDKRAKEKKMQWKLLRENEELKLENLTLKHKIRKWIESNTVKNKKIPDCPDIGFSNIPSESLEKENKNYKTKGRRGRRKFKEIGGELENEISTKVSKTWRNAKTCIKPKKKR